jgi:hypothetical protein
MDTKGNFRGDVDAKYPASETPSAPPPAYNAYQPQSPNQYGQQTVPQPVQYQGYQGQGFPAQYPGYPVQYPAPNGTPQQGAPGTVFIIQQPAVQVASRAPARSYVGHIVFSCFVFWCCGWLFGLIAFILAVVASNYSSEGRTSEAARLGKASLGMSIAGVIVGVIIIVVILAVSFARPRSTSCSYVYDVWYCN